MTSISNRTGDKAATIYFQLHFLITAHIEFIIHKVTIRKKK